MSRRMADFDSTNEKPTAADEEFEQYVKKLESLVRAADRMREGVESAINSYRRYELDGWEIAVVSTRMQDYDTQRAAVGEIGEE